MEPILIGKDANWMDNLNEKVTILLVDDEPVILEVGTKMLMKLGYNALGAENGLEASQIFRDNQDVIGLVILDMKLPDETGSDTCKRLKEINPNVRVLHTSGFGIALGVESLDCGCTDFLQKPFKFEDLSGKLKNLLEGKLE
jgi:DNA-binding NtrC family response regulator